MALSRSLRCEMAATHLRFPATSTLSRRSWLAMGASLVITYHPLRTLALNLSTALD